MRYKEYLLDSILVRITIFQATSTQYFCELTARFRKSSFSDKKIIQAFETTTIAGLTKRPLKV